MWGIGGAACMCVCVSGLGTLGQPWLQARLDPSLRALTFGVPQLVGDSNACERPQARPLSSQEAPSPATTCGMRVGMPQAHSRRWGAGETGAGSQGGDRGVRGLLRCPPFPQPVSYVEQGCWGWMRELGHVQGAEQGLGHGEGGNTL